jgi:hypothetical protein
MTMTLKGINRANCVESSQAHATLAGMVRDRGQTATLQGANIQPEQHEHPVGYNARIGANRGDLSTAKSNTPAS